MRAICHKINSTIGSSKTFPIWVITSLKSYILKYKVPPHNPWISLRQEYARKSDESRVELSFLEDFGDFAKTRWAARPTRDALINFWVRTAYEGTFGDICCGYYVCYSFPITFGERYLREKPKNLTDLQRSWVEQWIDPHAEELMTATVEGINEYGAKSTEYECEKMRWIFLRATQYQIGTFDSAWNLSDPWPGEGEEKGVLAGAPN